jgi:ABC-type Mn2+/Zn2+ transport system ATPase subunit
VAPSPLVDVRDAAFGYGGRAVVRVDALRLDAGRCVGVFGANGSGKSTLVRGLVGLLPPLAGGVARRPGLRAAYVPQHRGMEPHWPMTGLDAASLAVSAGQRFGWMGRGAARRVRDALDRLGAAGLADRPFAALSGGQQQRLILAGALATDPDVLVLDEPTDGLDVRSEDALLEAVRRVAAGGVGVVMISHEIRDLTGACHAVAWVREGAAEGEPSRVELVPPGRLLERAGGG